MFASWNRFRVFHLWIDRPCYCFFRPIHKNSDRNRVKCFHGNLTRRDLVWKLYFQSEFRFGEFQHRCRQLQQLWHALRSWLVGRVTPREPLSSLRPKKLRVFFGPLKSRFERAPMSVVWGKPIKNLCLERLIHISFSLTFSLCSVPQIEHVISAFEQASSSNGILGKSDSLTFCWYWDRMRAVAAWKLCLNGVVFHDFWIGLCVKFVQLRYNFLPIDLVCRVKFRTGWCACCSGTRLSKHVSNWIIYRNI